MLSLNITIDIFLLLAITIASAGIGAIIRNRQLSAAQKRITTLEIKMLRAHAMRLELQKKGTAVKKIRKENAVSLEV